MGKGGQDSQQQQTYYGGGGYGYARGGVAEIGLVTRNVLISRERGGSGTRSRNGLSDLAGAPFAGGLNGRNLGVRTHISAGGGGGKTTTVPPDPYPISPTETIGGTRHGGIGTGGRRGKTVYSMWRDAEPTTTTRARGGGGGEERERMGSIMGLGGLGIGISEWVHAHAHGVKSGSRLEAAKRRESWDFLDIGTTTDGSEHELRNASAALSGTTPRSARSNSSTKSDVSALTTAEGSSSSRGGSGTGPGGT